ADTNASQSHHNRSSCEEGTDSRNGQGTDTNEPAKGSANDGSCACSGNCALRSFGIFLCSEIARATEIAGEEDRYIGVAETRSLKRVDGILNLHPSGVDTKDGVCHCVSPSVGDEPPRDEQPVIYEKGEGDESLS